MAARSLCLSLLDQGPELSNSDAIGAMDEFIHFVVQKKLGDSNRQNAAASKQLMESLVCVCACSRRVLTTAPLEYAIGPGVHRAYEFRLGCTPEDWWPVHCISLPAASQE